MTLIVATFAICLVTVLGAYWFFVVRVEEHDKKTVVSRLKGYRTQQKTAGVVLAPQRLSQIPWLDTLLSRRDGLTNHSRQLLVEAGVEMNVGTFLLQCFACGALGFFIGAQLLRMLSVALLLALAGGAAPYAYMRFKRSRRLKQFEEQFPEALDLVARALRAGHAFTTGIAMVADEIAAPVGPEFRRLYDEQNFGMSLPDALRAMAARVPVLDAKFFVTAVITQRESGGNLSEVLDNLASVMRDRFKLKRQIRVISAHGRFTAWILVAVPPVLGMVMYAINPTDMSLLFTDSLGVRMLLVAATMQILGSIIIARLVRVQY